jgi:RNA polymerase sigma factor (sigma-70 family)
VDDLLQETFIIAFQKAHRFDSTKTQAVSWLYGIAANLCRRYGRSRKRAGRFMSCFAQHAELFERTEGPDRMMIREEEIQTVHRAIQKLPFKQREVFVLFELEGMEGKEISALLNLKEGTVWTRLHYARKSFVSAVRKMVPYNE